MSIVDTLIFLRKAHEAPKPVVLKKLKGEKGKTKNTKHSSSRRSKKDKSSSKSKKKDKPGKDKSSNKHGKAKVKTELMDTEQQQEPPIKLEAL